MTRRLTPPVPLLVRCRPDGTPVQMCRAGRARAITHVAATWVHPAPWWSDPGDPSDPEEVARPDPLQGERTYYRVICESGAFEIFSVQDGTRWYLQRIFD